MNYLSAPREVTLNENFLGISGQVLEERMNLRFSVSLGEKGLIKRKISRGRYSE